MEYIEDAETESERFKMLHESITSKIASPNCFLDGMTSLQIACHFDAQAAELLIYSLEKLPASQIFDLLHDNSNSLKYTALHLALKNSMPDIAR